MNTSLLDRGRTDILSKVARLAITVDPPLELHVLDIAAVLALLAVNHKTTGPIAVLAVKIKFELVQQPTVCVHLAVGAKGSLETIVITAQIISSALPVENRPSAQLDGISLVLLTPAYHALQVSTVLMEVLKLS